MKKEKVSALNIKKSKIVNSILSDKRRMILAVAVIVIVPVLLIIAFGIGGDTGTYEYQMNEIRRTAFAGSTYNEIVGDMQKSSPLPVYAVFVSVSDGESAAKVACATGKNLTQAWDAAFKRGKSTVNKYRIKTKWVRVDVVNSTDIVNEETLRGKYLKEHQPNAFRYGIAFDDDYDTAVLAEEINAHDIIDYEDGNTFSLNRLNAYLKLQKRGSVKIMPEKIRVFTTIGFIYDSGNTYTLMHDKYNFSVREANAAQNKNRLEAVKSDTAQKLIDSLLQNGQFTYYISPIDGLTYSEDYLGADHAKAVSALAEQYRVAPDEKLKKALDSSVKYLEKYISHPDNDCAFLKDSITMTHADAEEVYLGDTALAAVALMDYIGTSGGRDVNAERLLRMLMNGVCCFFDEASGSFEHTLLYPSLESDDCVRDWQYNSMASYAMCRMYEFTGEQIWIDFATSAVKNMLETESYKSSADKWLMLSLKYLGKFTGNGDYYKNALEYLDEKVTFIANGTNFSPEYLDFLITGYEIFIDSQQDERLEEYTQGFDARSFVLTAVNYTDFLFNKYYYPENAMYFDGAQEICGNFFSTDKNFVSNAGVAQGYLYSINRYCENYDGIMRLYGMLNG